MDRPKTGDYQKRRGFFSFVILMIITGLVCYAFIYAPRPKSFPFKAEPVPAGYYKVIGVNDGDTIVVNMDGRSETVRFIGVDTPETHKPNTPVQCWGPEATEYTKDILAKNDNQIRLEADPINTNRDRYDRLLRYIYLKDGTLLNSQLIKDGQGFAYTSFPFEKSAEFKTYGETAKQQNLGLWNSCQVITNQYGSYETQGL